MTQSRLDSRCPLCGRYLPVPNGLPDHLPDCEAREDALDELEERARQIRRGNA